MKRYGNYISKSVETLTEEDNLSKTGNVTFDTIVNYKAAVAQKNHINVKLDTMIPYDMKLEDVDLYSLLGICLIMRLKQLVK